MTVFRNPDVALRHATLDFNGAAGRIQNAAELDQKAVAHHLEDAPAMLGHGRIEEFAAVLPKRAESALFIGLHETAIAHYVGRQDGCQTSLNLLPGGQYFVPLNRELILFDPETDVQSLVEAGRKGQTAKRVTVRATSAKHAKADMLNAHRIIEALAAGLEERRRGEGHTRRNPPQYPYCLGRPLPREGGEDRRQTADASEDASDDPSSSGDSR